MLHSQRLADNENLLLSVELLAKLDPQMRNRELKIKAVVAIASSPKIVVMILFFLLILDSAGMEPRDSELKTRANPSR